MGHSQDQQDGYQAPLLRRHTPNTTNSLQEPLLAEVSSTAIANQQLVPTNCGRMSTPTNENIILLGHITTKAMDIDNIFIFAIFVLCRAFLYNRCSINR